MTQYVNVQICHWALDVIFFASVNNGMDRFVAWTMSGHDLQSPLFATLPPHFSLIDTAEISAILHSVVEPQALA